MKEIRQLDRKQQYVVKEFVISNHLVRTFDKSKREYFLRELAGFNHLLPLMKKHQFGGIPFGSSTLFGFEVIMKTKGFFYDGKDSRFFTVNPKCTVMTRESVVNQFTETQFRKFVMDILSSLVDIQKLNLAHGDVTLSNMMLCKNKYSLIDWETNRVLDYSTLQELQLFGLSPMYYKIKFGPAWEPAFRIALRTHYFDDTKGYDSYHSMTSEYADNMIAYYSELFAKYSAEEAFNIVKYSLDLCAFGMVLYGILMRNRNINKSKHAPFIMGLFRMKDAATALREFKKKSKSKNNTKSKSKSKSKTRKMNTKK
jgi:hypothetical protein